jgi:hypothetical protein
MSETTEREAYLIIELCDKSELVEKYIRLSEELLAKLKQYDKLLKSARDQEKKSRQLASLHKQKYESKCKELALEKQTLTKLADDLLVARRRVQDLIIERETGGDRG